MAVGPYEDRQVIAAIRRELLREGQVFFIHNRVQSIDKAVAKIKELVPEARVAAAHGQMGEHQLEEVMVDFWEKRYDVLVCTTIVESGLDVSNANTMIIERADTLGLSQLHQLRGRVGRSRERAYAYFLYPPEKPLTETAHDRLAIFDCRDGRPQALPNRVITVERERPLAQRLDMRPLGKCFRREPPHAGEDRIEQAQPAVTAEHGDRLGQIVQGLALDPDQCIVAAFEIEPFGDVIE